MTWVRVCRLEELPDGEARRVDLDPPIAVFHVDGELFATADTCTHQTASLSEGFVDRATVECPAHFAPFCLRTGAALGAPAKEPVRTFATKLEDGEIFVEAP